MTQIILYFLTILLLVIRKKSRIVLGFAYLFLLVLFCFNTGIADRLSYEEDITLATSINRELLWQGLLTLFLVNQISIQYLYGIVGFLYITSLFYVTYKLSEKCNIVIACYMLGVFFLDVVQLRYTASLIFVLWGFYFLVTSKGFKSVSLFIIFILLSSFVHASNIIFLLFLIGKLYSRKATTYITFLSIVVLIFGWLTFTELLGVTFNISEKMDRIVYDEEIKSEHTILVTWISELIVVFMMMYANLVKRTKKIALSINFNYAMNFAILSMIFIPLIYLSPDIRRSIYFVFVILSAFLYGEKNFSKSPGLMITPFIVSLFFFWMSTFTGNRMTVFYPLFENNLLW